MRSGIRQPVHVRCNLLILFACFSYSYALVNKGAIAGLELLKIPRIHLIGMIENEAFPVLIEPLLIPVPQKKFLSHTIILDGFMNRKVRE